MNADPRVTAALGAWLRTSARGGDAVAAASAAAEALASDPWAVVRLAGALARAATVPAPHDLGLDGELQWLRADDPRAVARVPRGAPCPSWDQGGRRARGAWDTPAPLARRAVALAREAARGPASRALDPACGAGAFLVALAEAGLEAEGVEIEPATAAVARVAAPRATVHVGDGLRRAPGGPYDLVVGNPPFVPPERQDRALRAALCRELPWLSGRFDLAVPFAARAAEALAPGGGLCLVLPAPLLCQPYARSLRRDLSARHRITAIEICGRFPGAVVNVALLALRGCEGPAPLPAHGLDPASWSSLESLPWDPELAPGDPELLAAVRARSLSLGELCEIDTGVVAHGADGPKERLLYDLPGPGLLPYADARDLASGRARWIRYEPARMHRPKRLELFRGPKLLVQRIRGDGPVHAWLDEGDLIPGHTLNVARPRDQRVPPERLLALLRAPAAAGLARLAAGARLDLYPRELARWPVPRRWLCDPTLPLALAWELDDAEFSRLEALAGPTRPPGSRRGVAAGACGR